jgi:hypothetical protein
MVVIAIYGVATANFAPASPEAPAAVQQDGIPSGAVMFFDLATGCPDGWDNYPLAEGRYLVGVPDGGTLQGWAGEALTDKENRAVGLHNHVMTDMGHDHTLSDPGHGHVGEALKAHAIDRIWQDSHSHKMDASDGAGDGTFVDATDEGDTTRELETTGRAPTIRWQEGPDGEGHTHEIDIHTNTTGIAIAKSATGIEFADAGTVEGTNAPYLQLLVCIKITQ